MCVCVAFQNVSGSESVWIEGIGKAAGKCILTFYGLLSEHSALR